MDDASETITVDTPPPSPTRIFSENPLDSYFTIQTPVPSPKKRVANLKQSATRKKRKPHHTLKAPERGTDYEGLSVPMDLHDDEDCPGELDSYQAYAAAVEERRAGFYPLARDVYVVQGWDTDRKRVKDDWYHLQRIVSGDDVYTSCGCPSGRNTLPWPCTHERYIQENYNAQEFLQGGPENRRSVTLFARQMETEQDKYKNWFSVASQPFGNVVVLFEGDDAGNGIWQCRKDRESGCSHVVTASNELKRLLEVQGTNFDCKLNLQQPRLTAEPEEERSVSHRPIPPPSWCSLPSDPPLFKSSHPIVESPGRICVDEHARCVCGAHYEPDRIVLRNQGVIFGLTHSVTANVEVQACPACHSKGKRFIGPDARELGIFNMDNKKLFSYALLDEYTSAFTSSETPFVAWVTSRNHTYKTYNSPTPFVSETTFRAAWFAYVRLQHLDGNLACMICGPHPERVIWDGVTIAFRKDKITTSLQPPTTLSCNSPIRSSVRYQPNQQLIQNREVRQLLRAFLHEYDAKHMEGERESDGGATRNPGLDIETVRLKLQGVDTHLAALLTRLSQNKARDGAYKQFFYQVSSDDTALRLATTDDVELLESFLGDPTPHSASRLINVPAVYHILRADHSHFQQYTNTILQVIHWLLTRLKAVLADLLEHGVPLEAGNDGETDDWHKTGVHYSLPKIRDRPKYPRLRHEQKKDSGDRGGRCSKYYEKYGKRNLTGGIMGVWCTHTICYGFHCISGSEGRDDVFSALVTRWPKAPKVIVYDFACALGPFCLLREPEFFSNTKFLIDHFHSSNHKKCDPAWFLSTYITTDPRLANLNSSAAECGNSGLGRIRKSISYMSQGRAILYTNTFLAIWNRKQIRKQLGIVECGSCIL